MTSSYLFVLIPLLAFSFQQDNPLQDYRWKNRIVLVFESDGTSDKVSEQLDEFSAQKEELEDRDLLVFQINENSVKEGLTNSLITVNAGDLRKQFDVQPDEFRIFLIGKDGGVKLRSEEVISSTSLFALIDGMPMRRSELRRRNDN